MKQVTTRTSHPHGPQRRPAPLSPDTIWGQNSVPQGPRGDAASGQQRPSFMVEDTGLWRRAGPSHVGPRAGRAPNTVRPVPGAPSAAGAEATLDRSREDRETRVFGKAEFGFQTQQSVESEASDGEDKSSR